MLYDNIHYMTRQNTMEMERRSGELDLQEVISLIENIEKLPENERIDPNFFRNVKKVVDGKEINEFPIKMIMEDLKKVEEKKEMILHQKQNLTEAEINANTVASFVETAVPEAIKKLGWLGDKIKVIRPSLYDDYFRGIDNIIQILPDEVVEDEKDIKCMGFSIDFTISDDAAKKKVFEAALAIAKGKVPSIKYFNTNIITKKGKQNVKIRDFPIPKIIISCPHKILEESQEDLLNFEKNPNDVDAKERAEDTKLKYYFIRECLTQLEFFAEVAKKFANINAEKVYLSSLESLRNIMDEQGIDDKLLDKKNGKILGLMNDFDLDANDGQLIQILSVMKNN